MLFKVLTTHYIVASKYGTPDQRVPVTIFSSSRRTIK